MCLSFSRFLSLFLHFFLFPSVSVCACVVSVYVHVCVSVCVKCRHVRCNVGSHVSCDGWSSHVTSRSFALLLFPASTMYTPNRLLLLFPDLQRIHPAAFPSAWDTQGMIQTHAGGHALALARLYLALARVYVRVGKKTVMTALAWLERERERYLYVYVPWCVPLSAFTHIYIYVYLYIYI